MAKPDPHPSNYELESYLLDRLAPGDVELIEKHYLTCEHCVGRISETAVVIDILQAAPRPWPRDLEALRQGNLPVTRTGRVGSRNLWATATAATLILSAAANIYQATRPVVTVLRPPAQIVGRMEPTIRMPLESASVTVAPSQRPRRARRRAVAQVRRMRPVVSSRPERAFLPPPDRNVSQVQVAGLEMPGLEITPEPGAAGLESPSPAVPEFRERRNRLVRAFTAIARRLKPRSTPDGAPSATFSENQ